MAKFKIGDSVRITELEQGDYSLFNLVGFEFGVGDIGIIQEKSICPYIKFEKGIVALVEDQLELVEDDINE